MTRRDLGKASKTLVAALVLVAASQNACKSRETPSNPQVSAETSSASLATGSAPPRSTPVEPRTETAPEAAEPSFPDEVKEDPEALALAYAAKVPLLDKKGALLPQIEECPVANSATFQARMRLLFLAIVKDDPNLAIPAYFPLAAYGQVKANVNPDQDRNRLLRAFARDVHKAHLKLGAHADGAEFVAIEVPDSDANFVNPGSEGNKVGYFRVAQSRLTYRDAVSAARSITIASLVSWRSEWYVLNLF